MSDEIRDALADEIAEFCELLGPELVPGGSVRKMLRAIGMMAAAVPDFVIECDLGAPQPVVDLTFRIHHERLADLLAEGEHLPTATRRMLKAWSDPSHDLSRVRFIEFEFDLDTRPDLPWGGVGFHPPLRGGDKALLRASLGMLSGGIPLDADVLHHLDELLAALPSQGYVTHMAVLHTRASRASPGVRLLAALEAHRVRRFLADVAWPGAVDMLMRQFQQWTPYAAIAGLDLQVRPEGMAPSVAFYRDFRAPRLADWGLREVLEAMARTRPAHRIAALERWVERCEARIDRELTVKIALGGQTDPSIKVYLSALR